MYQFNFIQTFNSDFINTPYTESHFANSFQEHPFDKHNEDRVHNDDSCLNKNIATNYSFRNKVQFPNLIQSKPIKITKKDLSTNTFVAVDLKNEPLKNGTQKPSSIDAVKKENIEFISKKPSYAHVVASQKLSPEPPQQQLTFNHATQKQVNIPHVRLITSNENENLQKTQSSDFSNLVREKKEYENIVLPKISEFNNDIEIIQKKISYANAVKNPQVFQKCQNEPLLVTITKNDPFVDHLE